MEVALKLADQIQKLRKNYKDAPKILESMQTQLCSLTKNSKPIQIQADAHRLSVERAAALKSKRQWASISSNPRFDMLGVSMDAWLMLKEAPLIT